MIKSMAIAEQILEKLGSIQTLDGNGIQIIPSAPKSDAIIKMMGLKKKSTFSVYDPEVVTEAKKLAQKSALFIVHDREEYMLYSLR